MARLQKVLLFLIACILFSLSGCDGRSRAEDKFIEDIDAIAEIFNVMYAEADAKDIHWPIPHIAFADIDFDEIPEFFYGYQTMTGSHNKIWYRMYSLMDRAIITSEHDSDWYTALDDEECAIFTGPDAFIEGYYLDDLDKPRFVTKTWTGPVTGPWMDYVFFEYTDSKLLVSTAFECDENLTPVKQVWSETTLETLEEDILDLLEQYHNA
jgi:hypothetical protein